MDLDFHSGTRKPVMPKKKVFVARNLEDCPFYHSKKENQNFKLCFPEASPLSASSLRTVFQEIALSENPNTQKKTEAHPPLSKARFELAPSEEERHLKPPPWTARPSRL
jgi:hypothetical protein